MVGFVVVYRNISLTTVPKFNIWPLSIHRTKFFGETASDASCTYGIYWTHVFNSGPLLGLCLSFTRGGLIVETSRNPPSYHIRLIENSLHRSLQNQSEGFIITCA